MEDPRLVTQAATPFDRLCFSTFKAKDNVDPSFQSGESASSLQESNTSGMHVIRNSLTSRGISEELPKSYSIPG